MALNFHGTLAPMVKEVAGATSRRFPSNILAEDTEQTIWLWAYENEVSISRTIEANPEEWIAMVGTTMRKVAYDYCFNEKAALDLKGREDDQKYGLKQVRVLLADVFDYDDWQSFAISYDGQPRGKNQANMTGDRIAELVDVKIALSKIREEQYNTLVWHYKYGYTVEQLSEEYDSSIDAARKRLDRAVQAVRKALGPKEQPEDTGAQTGRRSVRSNAAWRAASESYYEE